MPHTPPPVKVTLGPLARLRLRKGYAEATKKVELRGVRIGALAFGRTMDASIRDASDYFLADYPTHDNPVLSTAQAMRELLRPFDEKVSDLLRNFASDDPVDISVGLDNLRAILTEVEESDHEAVIQSVCIGAELLAHLREDPGLTADGACKVLTYAALESYYYRRATADAKKQFDAFRDLIRLATGRTLDCVNQEEDLGFSLVVWEGWQALRSLGLLFELPVLGSELKAKGARFLPAMCFCADVILRANETPLEIKAVKSSVDQLALIARERGHPEDLHLAKPMKAYLEEVQAEQPTPPPELPKQETREKLEPLSKKLRSALSPITDQERAACAAFRPRKREPELIAEELQNLVERYEILLAGDDNSLVFEIAPVLQTGIRLLFHELTEEHTALEKAIYQDRDGGDEALIQTFRSLAQETNELIERFRELVDSLASGDLDIGYETDTIIAQDPRSDDIAAEVFAADGEPDPLFGQEDTSPGAPPLIPDTTIPDAPADPLLGIILEESIVSGISSDEDDLTFSMRFALHDWHPDYRGRGTLNPGRLELKDAQSIRWHRVSLTPRVEADGTATLGIIRKLVCGESTTQLEGEWGAVELKGATMKVRMT